MQGNTRSEPGHKTPLSFFENRTVTLSVATVFLIASAASVYQYFHLQATGRQTASLEVAATVMIICFALAIILAIWSNGRSFQKSVWLIFISGSLYLLGVVAFSLFVMGDVDLAIEHAVWFWPIELALYVTLERRLATILASAILILLLIVIASFFITAGINPVTDVETGLLVQVVMGQAACLVLLGGLAVYREAALAKAAKVEALEETAGILQSLAAQAERDRKSAIEALQIAEAATQARETFLATMGHELRTPLNAIIGFSQVLENGMFREPLPKEREYSSDIRKSGEHMLALVNQLLEFSRLDSQGCAINMAPHSLAEISDDTIRMMRVLAEQKSVKIIRSWDIADEYDLETDQQAVRQILLNLFSNAVKFTPHGGSVSLYLIRQEDGVMVIEVQDTGIGIAPDKVKRVCEPFFQVTAPNAPNVGGTGLGLSIVVRLTELLGGTLEIESEPGKGTCVRVRLPSGASPGRENSRPIAVG